MHTEVYMSFLSTLFTKQTATSLQLSLLGGWHGSIGEEALVHDFEDFSQVRLHRSKGSNDGRRSKTMGDEAEVGQITLYLWFQDRLGTRVSNWRSVLIEDIHELFQNLFRGQHHIFACHDFLGIQRLVLLTVVFGTFLGGELRLAQVPIIPR